MRKFGILAAGLGALAALALPVMAQAAPALTSVGSFSYPTYVTAAPGDQQRVFVVERAGRVKLVKNGTVLSTPFLDISSSVSDTSGPGGLLSIAFPPDYAQSARFYALYTDTVGIRVVEFKRSNNPDLAKSGSRRIVLTQAHSSRNDHYGGQLQFGPDGLLYVSIGDGGGVGDPDGNGQNLGVLWGKLLRIDPRQVRSAAYRVPSDNPFVGVGGARREIWAYGLRNPWRFSFDRSTGALTIGDVGQAKRDEVDFATQASGGGRGANFGWNCFEGSQAYESAPASCTSNPPANPVAPVLEQPLPATAIGGWCRYSITGGYVVRDSSVPTLNGRYVYGDFCSGEIRSAQLATPAASGDASTGLSLSTTQLASFGEDTCGHVYVAALASPGQVYRFTEQASACP